MDEMEKFLDAVARGAFSEELFRRTAQCYAVMYNELKNGEYKVPEVTAREIVCSHIEALGTMGNGHTEG
jgi:hypothetical protein